MSQTTVIKAGRVMAADEFSFAGKEYFITDVTRSASGDVIIRFVPNDNHTHNYSTLVLDAEAPFEVLNY